MNHTSQLGRISRTEITVAGVVVFVVFFVAIPLMLRTKLHRNHKNVHYTMETIAEAENSFKQKFRRYADLKDAFDPRYAPDKLSRQELYSFRNGVRDGYSFHIDVVTREDTGEQGFEAHGVPLKYKRTGLYSFYVDENGPVRAGDTGGFPGDATLPEFTLN